MQNFLVYKALLHLLSKRLQLFDYFSLIQRPKYNYPIFHCHYSKSGNSEEKHRCPSALKTSSSLMMTNGLCKLLIINNLRCNFLASVCPGSHCNRLRVNCSSHSTLLLDCTSFSVNIIVHCPWILENYLGTFIPCSLLQLFQCNGSITVILLWRLQILVM